MKENSEPAGPRILIVDDEPMVIELLSVSLRFQGFDAITAASGTDGLRMARELRPDALIVDVRMPDLDGFALLRALRAEDIDAPVLFLTALDQIENKVVGLNLGADDYVTKPFDLEEVVARLRVVLRRAGAPVPETDSPRIRFADLELDTDTREVWKAGEPVALSPTEFSLLSFFIERAGTVVTKPQILDQVWQYDFGGDAGVVESYVSYLRRKIDTTEPKLIHTIRGIGYVMRRPRSD